MEDAQKIQQLCKRWQIPFGPAFVKASHTCLLSHAAHFASATWRWLQEFNPAPRARAPPALALEVILDLAAVRPPDTSRSENKTLNSPTTLYKNRLSELGTAAGGT